jgi:hypothetical protein
MLRSEVMWLQRIRPGGEHATLKSADDVLAKIGSTDGREIGRILDFKFSDYLEIGRRRDRCPSVLRPVDKTDDEIKGHRASIRNSPEKKAAKAETEKARRLRKKEEEAQQPPTNDLIAQRCKAIVGFAKKYPGKHRTGDLVRSLRPKKVFEGLTAKTCRNAVDKLLKLAESGKLPALSDHLTVIRETAKNRRATYTVEYRK